MKGHDGSALDQGRGACGIHVVAVVVRMCSPASLKMALDRFDSFVRHRVELCKNTHEEVSRILQSRYPGVKGFSTSSVKKFCILKNIHKTDRPCECILDQAISRNIDCVCIITFYHAIIVVMPEYLILVMQISDR